MPTMDDPMHATETNETTETAESSSDTMPSRPTTTGGVAADILRAYVERVERLEEEKRALAADIREVYAEAKGNGYEPKIMRKLVTLRRMDQADLQEEDALLDLYRDAVGV